MTPLSVWDPVKRCRVLNPKAFEPEATMNPPKTTLAPNAPWPNKATLSLVPQTPRPPNSTDKVQRTDNNFKRWATKNLGENYGK